MGPSKSGGGEKKHSSAQEEINAGAKQEINERWGPKTLQI
jgi:hypothetical protein